MINKAESFRKAKNNIIAGWSSSDVHKYLNSIGINITRKECREIYKEVNGTIRNRKNGKFCIR